MNALIWVLVVTEKGKRFLTPFVSLFLSLSILGR